MSEFLELECRSHENKEQDTLDPISFDCTSLVEDWVTGKNICVEDSAESADWMALDTPSSNTTLWGQSNDEFEEIGAGFNDYEILNRVKDSEEDNVDENAKSIVSESILYGFQNS
ncbi:hypothetical protein HS088_TW16G00274 [Tripterygium wilfordii]|uniref:Uncharacterized protein n=1 Tax=Tripterygium wilfordii TaxID=458696 RepID=A0A7J7CID5_TRIWF|nr:hypothetical protein HS088_TW16G00274 [Tripterygium wilfordii]